MLNHSLTNRKTVTQEQLKKLFEHLGEFTEVVLPPAKSDRANQSGLGLLTRKASC
ncbi:hypothetical protein ACP70R_000851 [Stipagrostis hirtigluma subsp. patula]